MAKSQSEPTMDEILASIRRIISEEDEAPASAPSALEPLKLEDDAAVSDIELAEVAAAAQLVEDEPQETEVVEAAPEIVAEPERVAVDVAEPEPELAQDPLDDVSEPSIPEQPEFEALKKEVSSGVEANLISNNTAQQAYEAFGALHDNIRVSGSSGRTIEDMVEVMLRPMLQEWLDRNLPRIVEEKVEEEVRRIARRR